MRQKNLAADEPALSQCIQLLHYASSVMTGFGRRKTSFAGPCDEYGELVIAICTFITTALSFRRRASDCRLQRLWLLHLSDRESKSLQGPRRRKKTKSKERKSRTKKLHQIKKTRRTTRSIRKTPRREKKEKKAHFCRGFHLSISLFNMLLSTCVILNFFRCTQARLLRTLMFFLLPLSFRCHVKALADCH